MREAYSAKRLNMVARSFDPDAGVDRSGSSDAGVGVAGDDGESRSWVRVGASGQGPAVTQESPWRILIALMIWSRSTWISQLAGSWLRDHVRNITMPRTVYKNKDRGSMIARPSFAMFVELEEISGGLSALVGVHKYIQNAHGNRSDKACSRHLLKLRAKTEYALHVMSTGRERHPGLHSVPAHRKLLGV